MVKMVLSFLRKSLLGSLVICLILAACGFLFSAKFEEKPLKPNEKELAFLKQLKDQDVDTANPIRLQVDVDYAEGVKARWYPKEESPVLKTLVARGQLPPVQDRVGGEPLVLRGIDGEGNHGGTMYRIKDFGGRRFAPLGLVRWSPQGYPLVPNVAKSYSVSADQTVFIFKLRKGMKWSDGQPFTSADILYWWEAEQLDPQLSPGGPSQFFVHQGNPAKVEAPDEETIVFRFSAPYSLFLERLAAYSYPDMCETPKHFMEKFHPLRGDKKLIREVMSAHNLINENAVYAFMRVRVERPSLAPWICRTESVTPPITYIRNPSTGQLTSAGGNSRTSTGSW
jgi:ABC-type transport system substrate-binding protein